MTQDRIARLVHAYFNRPHAEYLFLLNSIKKQGGLSDEEIKAIQSRLPHIHASDIIRQATISGA